jgi:hypothetical protein
MEGSLVAYKVFTNGSVLQASEVNENLMRQSVAVFSNAAARTAAITSPVEGQLTYLEDTNLYASWNGSSWVSPFGMTLLNATSFSSASSVSIDNVFTSAYETYRIVLTLTASGVVDSSFQLRVGGVAATTNYFAVEAQINQNISTNVQASNLASVGGARFGRVDGASLSVWEIAQPAAAAPTMGVGQSFDSSQFLRSLGMRHGTATAYDGFSLTLNASTGSIRVYGVRK